MGWHGEVGLHTVRLIANGVFDRHPNLHIILGLSVDRTGSELTDVN